MTAQGQTAMELVAIARDVLNRAISQVKTTRDLTPTERELRMVLDSAYDELSKVERFAWRAAFISGEPESTSDYMARLRIEEKTQ